MAWPVHRGPADQLRNDCMASASCTQQYGPCIKSYISFVHKLQLLRQHTIAEGASGVETAENLDDMVRILVAAEEEIGRNLEMVGLRVQARSV